MKESAKLSGIGARILIYGAVAGVVTIFLSMACSLLILKEVLPEGKEALYTAIISVLSVAGACFAACRKQTAAILPLTIGIASVYYAIVLLAKIILFPGAAVGLLTRAAVVYLTAIALAFLRTGVKTGKRGRRYPVKR